MITEKNRVLAYDFGKQWRGKPHCEFEWKDIWCYECDTDEHIKTLTKPFWGHYYKCTKCDTIYNISRGDKMGGGADSVRLADWDEINRNIKKYPQYYELAPDDYDEQVRKRIEEEKKKKSIPNEYTKLVKFNESILNKSEEELKEYFKDKKLLSTYKYNNGVELTLCHFPKYDGTYRSVFKEYFSDNKWIHNIEIYEKYK